MGKGKGLSCVREGQERTMWSHSEYDQIILCTCMKMSLSSLWLCILMHATKPSKIERQKKPRETAILLLIRSLCRQALLSYPAHLPWKSPSKYMCQLLSEKQELNIFCFSLLNFFFMLEKELKALHMCGMHSATKLHPWLLFLIGIYFNKPFY